ncbi:MAG: non-canonical purine NTP pyrophosphatase [Pirellulales bacterium]|nr:non-canonical purine NTP pyrophosphatase [Pirellulales bacterium]
MSPPPLVLGTHNRKKAGELVDLLAPWRIPLLTLADLPGAITVDETGASFAENAALKAATQARHLGHWVLGEDSGLCVDALNGAPGIYSARFSGPEATDQSNNLLLQDRLREVPPPQRTAYYICSAALSDPTGKIVATSEGRCHGLIRSAPSGGGGFGYDPYFEVREYHRTFAELGPVVKAVLSHRARSLRQILPALLAIFSPSP